MTENNAELTAVNEEYSVHLYRLHPSTIADNVLSIVADSVDEIINKAHDALRSAHDKYPSETLDSGNQKMKELITRRTNTILSRLRTFLAEILVIPPHVVLPADSHQREEHSKAEKLRLQKDIEQIKRKIMNAVYMKAVLLAELEAESKMLDRFRKILNCLEKIEEQAASNSWRENGSLTAELCRDIQVDLSGSLNEL